MHSEWQCTVTGRWDTEDDDWSSNRTLPRWSSTVTASDRREGTPEHPWRGIDLDVYEQHMGDPRVGQLQRLHEITGEQFAAYPSRAIGCWGSREETDST